MKWLNQAIHIGTSAFVIYSSIFSTRRCVSLKEDKNKARRGREDNPALSPALRVRRGSPQLFGLTTDSIGSRASGYSPDLVPFRRCAGAPRPTAPAIAGARRPCPHGPLGRSARESPEVGRVAPRTEQSSPARSIHDGAQRRRARSGTGLTTGSNRSLKRGARSWAIELNRNLNHRTK